MSGRIVDRALWRSAKLKNVPEEYRAEYANLIPLAEANGAFEADPDKIWADVYSYNRANVTVETVKDILDMFENAGMLHRYNEDGKVWGYWNGIEKPGRLPSESHLDRYTNLPPLPSVSSESSGTVPDAPARFGLGLGLGLGKGLDMGATKPFDKNQTVETKISAMCRELLGDPEDKKIFRKELREISRGREQEIIDLFRVWTRLGYSGKKPISSFIRAYRRGDSGLVQASMTGIQPLIDKMVQMCNGDVTFNSFNTQQISAMTVDYTSDEILRAFQEFWARFDAEQGFKWAAKDFIEKAPQFIRLYRVQLETQKLEEGFREKAKREAEKKSLEDILRTENEQTEPEDDFFDKLAENPQKDEIEVRNDL